MVASCAAINVTRCGTTCREIWLTEILNDSGNNNKINHEGYFFYFFEFFFRLQLVFYRLFMIIRNFIIFQLITMIHIDKENQISFIYGKFKCTKIYK